jgi:taurine--2-oxoglutarate transaminase
MVVREAIRVAPEEDEVVEMTTKYTYGTWRFQKGWKPMHVVDAEGCYFFDIAGRKYLDFSSQLMCCTFGHKNKAIIDAICQQARTLPYIGPHVATDVRAELSKLLLEVLPKGLEKFFFATSGTEANEAAIKITRFYTGKYKMVSRYASYHGSTPGSIALTGDPRRWPIEPAGKVEGVVFAPDCNCYRCPFKMEYPECGVMCAEYVDYMIKNEANVGAIFIEPVVGTNGILVPPKEYLPRLRQIADENGALFIVDEVMSAWGRTGTWFAVDHWNVKPDILTTAKGITGAYVPLGVTATTRKISDYFEDHHFTHGHTYEAHPMTLGPAIAAIKEFKRLDLNNRSRKMGEYLGKRLNELKEKHMSVGDVRGLGLFWAVELAKNRRTKEPFNTRAEKLTGKPLMVDRIAGEMMKHNVFVQSWINHLVIAPPLIITEREIDEGVNAIDEALKIPDQEAVG